MSTNTPEYLAGELDEYNHNLYSQIEFMSAAKQLGHLGIDGLARTADLWLKLWDISTLGLMPRVFIDIPRSLIDSSVTVSDRLSRDYPKPEFGLETTIVDGEEVAVKETVVDGLEKAFGGVLHFEKDTEVKGPQVFIASPLSGHYSTLLKDTVRQLLPDHDVYITYYRNARDVPLAEGRFGVEEFTDYLIDDMVALGPDTHVLAVCQPGPEALAAVASLAETNPALQPASLTLMGSPIDVAAAPTDVARLAQKYPIEQFKTVIGKVPEKYAGNGRLVYPGLVQLTSFMLMNAPSHVRAHWKLARDIMMDNSLAVEQNFNFYDEYFAVLDMPREFYLETVQKVFQDRELAQGTLRHHGKLINLGAITTTALLTIEGDRDDICAPGQTQAALDLCTNVPLDRKAQHIQAGVGHYGLFSGSKWANEIEPLFAHFIRSMSSTPANLVPAA